MSNKKLKMKKLYKVKLQWSFDDYYVFATNYQEAVDKVEESLIEEPPPGSYGQSIIADDGSLNLKQKEKPKIGGVELITEKVIM